MKKHGISREDHAEHEKKKGHFKWVNTASSHKRKRRLEDIAVIKSSLGEKAIKSVLCLGARFRTEIDDFENHFESVTGIDILENQEKILCIDAHDMHKSFKENEFDLVYSSHSLEHMVEADKVIKNIRLVARKGCFINLPVFSETYNSHCTLFDLCKFLHENKFKITIEDLKSRISSKDPLFDDFKNLGDYTVSWFSISENWNEFSLLLTWK